jgi:uncharacterized membrane-anchored protein
MRMGMGLTVRRAVLFVVVGVLGSWSARAQAETGPGAAPSASAAAEPPKPEYHWQEGPQTIRLPHDISIQLPERHAFLGGKEAAQLMEKNGSFHNDNLVGLVVGKGEDDKWFVSIRFDEEGYVKDTDAIDADQLLTALKEGTEEANKERQDRGFSPFHVEGWSEPPHYDRAVHHLVWALTVNGDDGRSANFNTRVLGRRGIVSLNLVCDPEELAADKPEVAALLDGTSFKNGSRYEDFDSKTDKVAEYGLAGLVLGGVGLGALKLAKVGLIAKFWNVILAALIAAKKAVVLAIAAAVAFLKRLFGRKKAAQPAQSP